MIEVVAIVLLGVTVVAWLRVATPHLAVLWGSLVRDLDPPQATQHATLFGPAPPP